MLSIMDANVAAFKTGLERNADIVFAASYAPLLQVRDPSYSSKTAF